MVDDATLKAILTGVFRKESATRAATFVEALGARRASVTAAVLTTVVASSPSVAQIFTAQVDGAAVIRTETLGAILGEAGPAAAATLVEAMGSGNAAAAASASALATTASSTAILVSPTIDPATLKAILAAASTSVLTALLGSYDGATSPVPPAVAAPALLTLAASQAVGSASPAVAIVVRLLSTNLGAYLQLLQASQSQWPSVLALVPPALAALVASDLQRVWISLVSGTPPSTQ